MGKPRPGGKTGSWTVRGSFPGLTSLKKQEFVPHLRKISAFGASLSTVDCRLPPHRLSPSLLVLGLGARHLRLPGGDDDRPDVQFVAAQSVGRPWARYLGKNLPDLRPGFSTVVEGGLHHRSGRVHPWLPCQRDAPSGTDEPSGEALARAGVDLQRQASRVRVEGHVLEHHARRRVEIALLDRLDE